MTPHLPNSKSETHGANAGLALPVVAAAYQVGALVALGLFTPGRLHEITTREINHGFHWVEDRGLFLGLIVLVQRDVYL